MNSSNFKTYMRMFEYMRPYLFLFIIISIVSFIITILEGFSLWMLGSMPEALLLGNVKAPATEVPFTIANLNEWMKFQTTQIIGDGSNEALVILAIMIAVIFTVKNVLTYGTFVGTQILNLKITRDIRNKLFDHIVHLPISHFDKNRSGNFTSTVINDVGQVLMSLTSALNQIIIEPIRLIFFIVLMIVINAKLTLAVFIVYPLTALLIVHIGKSVKRRSSRWLEKFSHVMSNLSESLQCIRVIKTFGKEGIEANRFAENNSNYLKSYLRFERIRLILGPLTELVGIYVTLGLLLYGGTQIISGTSTFNGSDFFRFLVILVASYKPLKTLGGVNSTIQSGIAAAERIFKIHDTVSEKTDIVSKPAQFTKEIEFNNVHFQYDETTPEVLKGISFSIEKGQKVALVGPSGAGKTTILDLLPRFYEINDGEICIDGVETRTISLSSIRKLLGVVSQESILFDDTIRFNIAYGCDTITDEKIIEAAKAANALEFIENMPFGFDTKVGERGSNLSGGQRQRIAIARAILRNPEILILDEATSALDTESERLVQSAIDNLLEGRTALIVAHRLSTVRNADKIVVIEDGMIMEQGSHQELYNLNGRYRYYHDIQFASKSVE